MTLSQIKTAAIVVLTGLVIFLGQDYFEKDEIVVDVPIEIEFETPTIENRIEDIPIPKPVIVTRDNPINANLLDENEELKKQFDEVSHDIDSLKALYAEAIKIRQYPFEVIDDTLTIKAEITTRGTIATEPSLTYTINSQKYTVKENQEVVIPIPKQNKMFATIAAGTQLGNINDITPVVRAGIMFKNKKDLVLSADIDTKRTVSIGIGIKL